MVVDVVVAARLALLEQQELANDHIANIVDYPPCYHDLPRNVDM